MNKLALKTAKFIEEQGLFGKSDKLLLAVSGGADSMCMAHILLNLGYKCIICHCNFKLRGEESDAEEAFVKSYYETLQKGQKWHIAGVFSAAHSTEKYAKEHGISIEMAARDLRYDWFEKIAKQENAQYICTAHNANDNTETLFLNLTRGTGIKGLTGINPKRDNIRRPLLSCTREEIIEYLKENNVPFKTDSSNLENIYKRNKIRNEVTPVFTELNPSFQATMQENIARFNSVQKQYSSFIENLKSEVLHKSDTVYYIFKTDIGTKISDRFIFSDILSDFNFSEDTIFQALTDTQKENGKSFSSKSHILTYEQDKIIITKLTSITDKVDIPVIVSSNCETEFYTVCEIEKGEIDFKEQKSIFLDKEKIEFPLQFRDWKDGDEFPPYGMKGRKKKIADYLNEIGITSQQKKKFQILVDNSEEIIWAGKNRINEKFAIEESTSSVIKIEFKGINC